MKTILLLGLEMNGYLSSIKESLEKKNYKVHIFEKFGKINKKKLLKIERIIRFLGLECKINFFKKKYNEIEKKFFLNYINELDRDYDYVLDLFAQSKYNFISQLRLRMKKAKFKLFIWDDLKYKKINNILEFYDDIFSYNLEDSEKMGVKYRSNFYIKEFLTNTNENIYNILYIGGLRDNKRIKILKKLDEIAIGNKFFLIGRNKISNYFRYKNYKDSINYLKEKSFTISEISKYSKQSKVILDLVYKEQEGLSLRPFEAIASKTKIITTNRNIQKYDFYNANNFFYLQEDLSNIEDLNDFLNSPIVEYTEEIRYKYSVDGFIDDIFWEEIHEKVKLIYNPHSGKRELLENFDTVFKCYQEKGYSIDIFRVGRGIEIKDTFTGDCSEYHHVLIAGGDGTVNNVVNAMKNSSIDLPIAVLPVGTANDFAGNFGISKNIEEACNQILDSEVRSIDLGIANDRYFVNILSTGLFTDISHKVDPKMKKNFGKLAYYLRGIKDAYNIKPLEIDVVSHENENLEEKYIMFVFNGRTAGRINLAYKAEIDDGMFDVILIKAKGIMKSINIFFKIINGTYLEDEEVVEYFKTDELFIHSDEEIIIDVDGEKGPKCPLEIRCIKGGLKVLGYR